MYEWTITKDHIAMEGYPEGTNCNAVGVCGPRDQNLTGQQIIEQGRFFQMYDDDDILYYEGYLVGGGGLEPLYDFGMPNAGCTKIKIGGKFI